MTTAHRPTWAPAKGGEEQGGNRMYVPSRMTSAKDQPGQLTMKFRQEGQASAADILRRDLRVRSTPFASCLGQSRCHLLCSPRACWGDGICACPHPCNHSTSFSLGLSIAMCSLLLHHAHYFTAWTTVVHSNARVWKQHCPTSLGLNGMPHDVAD